MENVLKRIVKFIPRKIKKSLFGNINKLQMDIQKVYGGIMFSSAIQDSEWLKYKAFSFEGWAMDAVALHNLFRILNDVKPKNIIEFGLGQSSKMVHQYAEYYKANAMTVEHDKEWIEYVKTLAPLIKFNILQTDLETVKVNGIQTVSYKNIGQICGNDKINLYIVDGPPGQLRYSRSQILDVVPEKLANDFCIFMHDTERLGEKETIDILCTKLNQNGVDFIKRDYGCAARWHTVICSKSWKFLTSIC